MTDAPLDPRELSAHDVRPFAVLWTEYFGGMGEQRAAAYRGDLLLESDGTINGALRALGAARSPRLDEFDTLGLSCVRSIPDALLDRWAGYDQIRPRSL